MSENRRDLKAVFIKADNEMKLEEKLQELSLQTLKMPHIINIYPKGSFVIAWVYVESKFLEKTIPEKIEESKKEEKEVEKKVKKKVKKKTSIKKG